MRRFGFVFGLVFFFLGRNFIPAQTHISVPLGHEVYYLLDQAEARGLCSPLPAVKPYTKARITEAIDEILGAVARRFGGLSEAERAILRNTRAEFTRGEAGLDLWKGMYRFNVRGKNNTRFSGDFGVAAESLNSLAFYTEGKKYLDTDTWGTFYFNGDVGEKFSFNVDLSGGIMRIQREYLGTYDTHATEFDRPPDNGDVNRRIDVYSLPKAFFPFTYKKSWDGFMFGPGSIGAGNMEQWPENVSVAARMLSEMSGSVFGGMLLLRAGRLQREWGAMTPGGSLAFNAAARPFIGLEAVFNPVSWLSFSSITGVLEFDNAEGIKKPAFTFQNAFSLQQLELNYKNIFHFDFGSSAIWPKRFELGYLFPLLNNFFYQNFIGNFDNVAVYFNMKYRYPGLGGVWVSVFIDEMEVSSMKKAFELDRHMFAYQAGIQGILPFFPFSSMTLSYTKIEPYNYTHTRDYLPWYSGKEPMETSYVNNGICLGYYLPPNSDEIKIRFDVRPRFSISGYFQYQLVRHGADYGPHQVDGSSLLSELDPDGRSEKESLKKYFLKDGAYQWMHITKVGAEYRFSSLPLTIYSETGFVISYFKDISDAEYNRYHPVLQKKEPRPSAVGEYPGYKTYILTIGFRLFN